MSILYFRPISKVETFIKIIHFISDVNQSGYFIVFYDINNIITIFFYFNLTKSNIKKEPVFLKENSNVEEQLKVLRSLESQLDKKEKLF